jgi:hypothetical protein
MIKLYRDIASSPNADENSFTTSLAGVAATPAKLVTSFAPSLSVWTGDMGNSCSDTWVTHCSLTIIFLKADLSNLLMAVYNLIITIALHGP